MKSAIPAVVVAAVTLWTAGASAQGRNFAGSWTIDSERTAAAAGASAGGEVAAGGAMAVRSAGGGGGGGRGGAVAGGGGGGAVASGGGGGMASGGAVAATGGGGGGARGGRGGAAPGPMTINIDASSFTLGSGTTTTAYKLDGSTTTIQTARGDVTAKAAWKGDKLVIETTSAGPDGPIVTTTSWYLDGDALVREMSTPSAGGTPTVRKTYFKKA